MDNQKILEEFGKKYTEEVYVKGFEHAKSFFEPGKMTAPAYKEIMDKISHIVEQLSEEEKEGFLLLIKDVILNNMFSVMNIFDTETNYNLLYSNDEGKRINLQEVAADSDYGNGFLRGEIFNWINNITEK